ncbi:MAG: formylglycine-generating enzyme family protein [Isosphaeraceae bacterium]
MHGGAWDRYDKNSYRILPGVEPLDSSDSAYRVIRGGSWGSEPYLVRSANRSKCAPEARDVHLGFRVARGQS